MSITNQASPKHMKTKTILGYLGIALLAILAVSLWTMDCGLWTTSAVALASMPLVLTEDQVKEFQGILSEMKGGWAELKRLPEVFASFKTENETLRKDVTEVRRLMATRAAF